ncbi:MAG: hypothetical protein EBZ74_00940 [Planctomycetia bacterium]|nr:hypothetical protein [Planctomycetia bacterium]
MDLKLHRPHGSCHHSGRPFAPGEIFYSALVRADTGLERVDVAADRWQGPPERALAWWRSAHPAAANAGPELAPVDALLDVLERLDGRPEDAPLRYLLALELVRRRVLRPVDRPGESSPDTLHLGCRRRDARYRVTVTPPDPQSAPAVQDRLVALLWSGDAA